MHNEGMLPANAQRAEKHDTAEHIRKQAKKPRKTNTTLHYKTLQTWSRVNLWSKRPLVVTDMYRFFNFLFSLQASDFNIVKLAVIWLNAACNLI